MMSCGTVKLLSRLLDAGRSLQRNNGLVQKLGNPLFGGLPIFRCATTEFVAAVEMTTQLGFAPAGDEFAALAAEEFGDFVRFHKGHHE